MSASLVGSEMCIRDRSLRPTGGPAAAARAGCPRPQDRQALQRSARPVSYTHLTLPTICSV
eukprot:13942434-Alexandrium_andersonii.AAC.1